MNKKRRKLKTGPVTILFCVVIFSILIFCILDIVKGLKSSTKEVKIIDSIPKFEYTLNEHDSDYVRDVFKKLKHELEEEIIDDEKYATYLSQIFVADFYTLEASVNKNDVGGVQFVYQKYQSDFLKKAKDTVYRYVENNIYGKRKQELPSVRNVEVTSLEQKLYNKEKITDAKAFYVDVEITYKEDLDYPSRASLILVHVDDRLEVASMES